MHRIPGGPAPRCLGRTRPSLGLVLPVPGTLLSRCTRADSALPSGIGEHYTPQQCYLLGRAQEDGKPSATQRDSLQDQHIHKEPGAKKKTLPRAIPGSTSRSHLQAHTSVYLVWSCPAQPSTLARVPEPGGGEEVPNPTVLWDWQGLTHMCHCVARPQPSGLPLPSPNPLRTMLRSNGSYTQIFGLLN